MFIIETFDKPNQESRIMVTFFDIATKKVLINERIKGKATGAGAIKAVIQKTESGEFNKWKKL